LPNYLLPNPDKPEKLARHQDTKKKGGKNDQKHLYVLMVNSNNIQYPETRISQYAQFQLFRVARPNFPWGCHHPQAPKNRTAAQAFLTHREERGFETFNRYVRP
jgi:hypothetical protein